MDIFPRFLSLIVKKGFNFANKRNSLHSNYSTFDNTSHRPYVSTYTYLTIILYWQFAAIIKNNS